MRKLTSPQLRTTALTMVTGRRFLISEETVTHHKSRRIFDAKEVAISMHRVVPMLPPMVIALLVVLIHLVAMLIALVVVLIQLVPTLPPMVLGWVPIRLVLVSVDIGLVGLAPMQAQKAPPPDHSRPTRGNLQGSAML